MRVQTVPATREGPVTDRARLPLATHKALISGPASGLSLVRGNHPHARAVILCPINGAVSIWTQGHVPRALAKDAIPWALVEGDGCATVREEGRKLSAEASWPMAPPITWSGFAAAGTPPELDRLACELAQTFGFSPGFVSIQIIGALSAAVCAKIETALMETEGEVWRERIGGLYVCGIAPSGARKTPLLEALLAPWRKLQREQAAGWARTLARWGRRVQAAKHKITVLQKADEIDEDELESLLEEANEPEPRQPSLIVSNATGPAFGAELAHVPSVFVATSEANELFRTLATSDGRLELEPLLKAYSGEPGGAVLRIGRRQPVAGVFRAAVLVLAQPSVLYGLAKNREVIEQGLFARFLWASIEAGQRPSGLLSPEASDWWAELVGRCMAMKGPTRDPYGVETGETAVIRSTPEQTRRLLDLVASLSPRVDPGGDLFGLGTWARKLHGQIARIAAIMSVVKAGGVAPTHLDPACFDWAFNYALEVLLPQARYVWTLVNWPANTDDARHMWTLARAAGVRTLALPSLDTLVRDWPPGQVDAAVETLCERGFAQITMSKVRAARTVDFGD